VCPGGTISPFVMHIIFVSNKKYHYLKLGMLGACLGFRFIDTVARELTKYKLDLMEAQIRWNTGDIELEDDYIFFCGKGNAN
jgi:hypothetical protein